MENFYSVINDVNSHSVNAKVSFPQIVLDRSYHMSWFIFVGTALVGVLKFFCASEATLLQQHNIFLVADEVCKEFIISCCM